MSNTKVFQFFNFFCPSLLRWMLLIKWMHWLSRNFLQHSPIFFRCCKISVLSNGETPSPLFLKSTNEKNNFFDSRFLNFLADFFTINIKLQKLKLMPQATSRTVNIRYKSLKKKGTPPYLLYTSNTKILNFRDTFVQICCGGCSW